MFKVGDNVLITDDTSHGAFDYPCKNKTGTIKAIAKEEAAILFYIPECWAPGCLHRGRLIKPEWGLWINMGLLARHPQAVDLKTNKSVCECNLMVTGCICGVMEAERKAKK